MENPPDSVPPPKGVGPVNPKGLTVPQDAVELAQQAVTAKGFISPTVSLIIAQAVLGKQERIESLVSDIEQMRGDWASDASQVTALRTALEEIRDGIPGPCSRAATALEEKRT